MDGRDARDEEGGDLIDFELVDLLLFLTPSLLPLLSRLLQFSSRSRKQQSCVRLSTTSSLNTQRSVKSQSSLPPPSSPFPFISRPSLSSFPDHLSSNCSWLFVYSGTKPRSFTSDANSTLEVQLNQLKSPLPPTLHQLPSFPTLEDERRLFLESLEAEEELLELPEDHLSRINSNSSSSRVRVRLDFWELLLVRKRKGPIVSLLSLLPSRPSLVHRITSENGLILRDVLTDTRSFLPSPPRLPRTVLPRSSLVQTQLPLFLPSTDNTPPHLPTSQPSPPFSPLHLPPPPSLPSHPPPLLTSPPAEGLLLRRPSLLSSRPTLLLHRDTTLISSHRRRRLFSLVRRR